MGIIKGICCIRTWIQKVKERKTHNKKSDQVSSAPRNFDLNSNSNSLWLG